MTTNEHGSPSLINDLDAETEFPEDLIGGGHHFIDVARVHRWGNADDAAQTKLVHMLITFRRPIFEVTLRLITEISSRHSVLFICISSYQATHYSSQLC